MERASASVIYLPREKPVETFPTGCTLLNLQNGGGWAHSRSINIVGDQSTGKTLLAIEACANFNRLYGIQNIRYNECELKFNAKYAQSVGLPEGIEFTHSSTVEEFNDDLTKFLESRTGNGPCLYIEDSFDGLSSADELERDIDKGSYQTGKAKRLHELFRRNITLMEKVNCTLVVISQTKDKIGITFGETKTRSGGHALDFYPSQIIWLSEKEKIRRKVSGVDRVVGVKIRSRNKKNHIGRPFREVDFELYFNYGIDDERSNISWLIKNGLPDVDDVLSMPIEKYKTAVASVRNDQDKERLSQLSGELSAAVIHRWNEIEDALDPPLSKY